MKTPLFLSFPTRLLISEMVTVKTKTIILAKGAKEPIRQPPFRITIIIMSLILTPDNF